MGKRYTVIIMLVIISLIVILGNVSATYKYNREIKYCGKIQLSVINFPLINEEFKSKEYSLKFNKLKLPIKKDFFKVKGLYITGWVAGLDDKMNEFIELVKKTEINAFVVDIKDSTGTVSYLSSVPEASQIKANRKKIKNISALITRLKKENIYLIGRIVAFKDPVLARAKRDRALLLTNGEKTWRDLNWISPYQKENWDYLVKLAREALELGFDEIQYDYVRFPALGNGTIQVVQQREMSKEKAIISFLNYAKSELAEYNAPISADVFGAVTFAKDDLGIGQKLETISEVVDIISPMIYPSHYANGVFNLPIPEAAPYETVYYSMKNAINRLGENHRVRFRPWLQDFSLKYYYDVSEVREQIKALYDLGIEEWLLWNPKSRYTKEAFLPDTEELFPGSYMETYQ
ncbi:hypothetical protein BBF96_06450 [Anoxybacter fermentans]|uniref:DUF4015 domain-containing protein n=1 Tax=Anoxybacter fermentans TaxID=1323375 RepID=A0A3Q9HQ58_9FIRM|nr:putative glycoside hydrolase [Anoxybacter fermentans]AZR73055.1 hypothetical protein BBF96_06450 [Anoxybacter fermentans]